MIGDGLVPVTNQTELGLLLAGGVVLSMGPPMDAFMGVQLDSGNPDEIEWAPAWAMAVVKLSSLVDRTPVALDSFLGPDGKRHTMSEPIIMQHATEVSRKAYVQKKMPGLLHDHRGQLVVCGHAMLVLRPHGDFREALVAYVAKLRRLEALRKNEADRA